MRLRFERGLRWGVLLACLAGPASLGAQAAAQAGATTGTGAVSGVVVDAVTGTPLAGATVSLGRIDVSRPSPRMVTDSKGRFIFHNLPPSAEYFLDARRFGYASTRYGWSSPDGSSAISAIRRIPVADGQWVNTITIPLWRFGAISGRVLDERGEPVVGVAVRAFGFSIVAGQSQIVGGPLATTDDRGLYRLAGVKPGRYVVSVLSVQSTVLNTTPEGPQARAVGELEGGGYSGGRGAFVTAPGIDMDGRHRLVVTNFATPPPPADGRSRAYPAVFFPGVPRAADAAPIEIRYGDTRTGIDFQLRPEPGVRVSGRLEGRTALPASLLLRLMPVGSERLGPGSEAATTTSDRDGSFTFLNVPEGSYTLIAQASIVELSSGGSTLRLSEPPGFPAGGISVGSSRGAPGVSYHVRSGQPSPLSGRAAVSVGNTDVTNLVVTMNSSVKVSGRVVFAEGAAPEKLLLGMTAHTAEGDMSLGQPRGEGVAGEGGMTFEVAGLLGGRYLLNVGPMLRSTPGAGMEGYNGPLGVMSIMSGGRDVVDTGFDGSLGTDFDDVVITLTTKVPTMAGVVRDAAGPAAAVVIVFPVERERWVGYGLEPRRFRNAVAGLDGKFRAVDLPQGDYFLVAVDAKDIDKWADPRFLAAAVPHATRVSLKWGASMTQDLTIAAVVVKVKALVLAAMVALGNAAQQAQPVREAIVQPTVGSASISGQVINDEEQPKPVRRAIVTLSGPDLRPSRGAITDDEGRFTFTNLPASRVTLTVTRASYITSVYGAKRPGRPGTAISLSAGQAVTGLVVKAWRGAAIAGILRDDTGAPVEGIPVSVIAARSNGTAAVLTLSNNPVTTNDLGEFRIFGLPPGTYVIAATPSAGGGGAMRAMTDAEVDAAFEATRRRTSSAAAAAAANAKVPEAELPRPFAYAPVYFPGTPILAQASPITLGAGQEHVGLEFALQRVATSIVEGVVARSDGQSAAGTTVQMTGLAPPGPFAADSPLVLQTTAGANGSFQIPQVPPGDYTLVARAGTGGAALWGSGSVSVSGADVTGVAIGVEPGATVSGRVRFDSATAKPPADLTRIRATMMPAEVLMQKPGTTIRTIAFSPGVPLRADGSFEVTGVPPGSFALQILPIDAASWWGRSAVLGERDLFDGLIEVGRASMTDVVVTFTDKRSELSGMLQTSSGAPASDVFVIAYATNPAMWGPRARRVQAVRPGVDGRFSIKDLPPGDYYLSAVTEVEQEELQESKFLEELVKASIKISIGEGEKKVQDLRMGGG